MKREDFHANDEAQRCGFCHCGAHQCVVLFSAHGHNAAICDACLLLAVVALADYLTSRRPPPGRTV